MSESSNTFKQGLQQSYSELLNKGAAAKEVFKDLNKYSSEMKENKVSKSHPKAQKNIKGMAEIIKKIDDAKIRKEAAGWMINDFKKQFKDFDVNEFLKMCGVNTEKTETKEDADKVSAKKQFAKDLQLDPDFEEFKKRAKYDVRGHEFTYGTPNVSSEDPYIKKSTKYGRPGKEKSKEETVEATGSGSSGAFVAPFGFKDSEFVRRSFAETPGVGKKIKEGYRGRSPFHIKITKLNSAVNDEGNKFKVGDNAKTLDTNETIEINGIIKKEGKIWAQFRDNGDAQEILIDGLIPAIKNPKKMKAKKIDEQVDGSVEKVEATEATGSGSVGGYSSPSMWAKSTNKKDWGPSRKTQIPGGGFVKVKKKCTKFPYCNQGDINALKITKNESVKDAIKNVSKKLNVSENVIITILEHEYEILNKRNK